MFDIDFVLQFPEVLIPPPVCGNLLTMTLIDSLTDAVIFFANFVKY